MDWRKKGVGEVTEAGTCDIDTERGSWEGRRQGGNISERTVRGAKGSTHLVSRERALGWQETPRRAEMGVEGRRPLPSGSLLE